MKYIKKYILLIFLIENLLAQSYLFGFSRWPFYLMLAIGALMLFSKELWSYKTFSESKPLYLLGILYILYQFTIGYETMTMSTLVYLIAKVTTFVIIVLSVVKDWEFYAKKVPIYLAFIVVFILIFGLNDATDLDPGERLNLGFGNANSTSTLSAFCLTVVLFFWNKRHQFLYFLIAALALYSMLAGGGRNAILILGISLMVWTGTSVKRIFPAICALLLIWGAISVFNLNLAGVDRLKATIAGEAGTNRELEREATKMMIAEKPWTGWGFEAENEGEAALVTELGSHNGYLDTIKYMGYPFAIVYFLIIFYSTIILLKYYKSKDMAIRFHLAVILSHLASALFEGLFTGVHEFSTNIIFYSLAVLTTYNYRVKAGLIETEQVAQKPIGYGKYYR